MAAGLTRSARQDMVEKIIGTHKVSSQRQLIDMLTAEGVEITQATLSRDLVDIGARKIRSGGEVYYSDSSDVRIDGRISCAGFSASCWWERISPGTSRCCARLPGLRSIWPASWIAVM